MLVQSSFLSSIAALYGVYFSENQEPAFSNYRLWESVGFVIAFAYSNYLCVRVKLVILLVVLLVGTAMYLASEFVHRKFIQEIALDNGEGEEHVFQPLKSTNYKTERENTACK